MEAEGNNYSIKINSNARWTWNKSDLPNWITSPEGIEQNGNQDFSFVVLPNNTIERRIFHINFNVLVDGSSVSDSYRIYQNAAAPFFSLNKEFENITSQKTSLSIEINSNVDWSWDGMPEWITSSADLTQNGNRNIFYNIEANNSQGSRQAIFIFRTQEGDEQITRNFSIFQEGLIDDSKPEITLLGQSELKFEASTFGSFIDPGAICFDTIDGDISANIEVSGNSIDLSKTGTYYLKYNCQDEAGNKADELIRKIVIEDTQPPEIILIGPPMVEITIGSEYSDAGGEAWDSIEGKLPITIESLNLNTNVAGDYIITIIATDRFGNKAQATRNVRVISNHKPNIREVIPILENGKVISLSITFTSYPESSYNLMCSKDLKNWDILEKITAKEQTSTSIIDTNLSSNKFMFYRIEESKK